MMRSSYTDRVMLHDAVRLYPTPELRVKPRIIAAS
jgi:hypothetical protein